MPLEPPRSATDHRTPAVRFRVEGGCARITLARPPLHILDMATIADLAGALAVAAGRKELSVLVLDAEGQRAFSAGVDIKDHRPGQIGEMLERFHGVLRSLLDLPLVSIAAVRGVALGGGCELAMACDLVLAADGATFGQPEIDVGCYPPAAAVLLPRLVGAKLAAELILAGRPIPARRAAEIGLINRVVPSAELDTAVGELAALLAAKPAAVLRIARRALLAGAEGSVESALRANEKLYMESLARCPDMAEGVAAFLEKRPPRWAAPPGPGSGR